MKMIKKGDIVSRNSYQNDILFFVEEIVDIENREKIAILKGVNIRIEADSPLDDLRISTVKSSSKDDFSEVKSRIDFIDNIYNKERIKYGKILHLDRR